MKPAPGQRCFFGIPAIHWLVLLACCLIGYWPLSSSLFILKNDAYVYFLPNRFLISDAIRHGHFPWWTPYLQMGHPLHGDMQSGAWNPLVWLISLVTRYNMTALHAETLLYILIGGVGMHKLTGISGAGLPARLLAGLAFMFSGFVIDTAQITVWTGSAAFLPWVFYYLHNLLFHQEGLMKAGLKGGLSLYLLLVAGYPSFLIMSLYLIFFGVLARLIGLWKSKQLGINEILNMGGALLLMGTCFLLLSLPAILSYLDYLPYYRRGTGTTLTEAQENPFTWLGLLSSFAPFSVTRQHDWLATNPTSRSMYAGIFTLFFLAGIRLKKWTGTQRFIAISTAVIFLFSLGDATPVRKWFFYSLPGMNLFRHPGTMRIFCIMGLLLLSATLTDSFLQSGEEEKKSYRTRAWGFAGILIALMVIAIPGSNISGIFTGASLFSRDSLKGIYDNMNFPDGLLTDAAIQLGFMVAFIWLIRKKTPRTNGLIMLLFALNLMLPAQLSIPATVVSRVSPAGINSFIANSPSGYPLPQSDIPMNDLIRQDLSYHEVYGPASAYLKQVAWIEHNVNPSISNRMKRLDLMPAIRNRIFQYPICYLADSMIRYKDSLINIEPTRKILFASGKHAVKNQDTTHLLVSDSAWFTLFEPGHMIIQTKSGSPKPLVIFQQFNKNWVLTVDDKQRRIALGNLAFMYAELPAGKHTVQLTYEPSYLRYTLYASLACLAVVLWLICYNRKK